jgi:hypothetical protein
MSTAVRRLGFRTVGTGWRWLGAVLIATFILNACSGGAENGSGVPSTSPSSSVPPSSSPSPVHAAVIPDGTYVQTAPITEADAIATGLKGADVRENLGRFTLDLDDGAFTLSQRPPKPVEFPLIIGSYQWTARGLVLTPSTFRGQEWILEVTRRGDRVVFDVIHTTSSFSPSSVRAGITTIFATHPWVSKA